MNKIIDKFKRWLELEKYAKGDYPYLVERFLTTMNILEDGITEEIIEDYVLLTKQRVSNGYLNNHIKAIKCFCKFLKLDIKIPKLFDTVEAPVDSFTLDYFVNDIVPLIEIMFETREVQVKALLYFMFFTGARKNEVRLLKRDDFDLKKCRVKIFQPKQNTTRIAVYPKEISSIFIEYFTTEDEVLNAFNLNLTTIDNIFRTLKPHLKDVNLRPHLMRHSFCTFLAQNRMNIKFMQKLTGHKSLKSLEKYIDANIDNVQSAYDDIFKEDKKKKMDKNK